MAKSKEQKRLEAAQREAAKTLQNQPQGTVTSTVPRDAMVKPYLIQRGEINRHGQAQDRLSDAVRMEYMGSSEFEFGGMARSLKAMRSFASCLALHAHPSIRDAAGNALFVLHGWKGEDAAQYNDYLTQLRANAIFTHERTYFEATLRFQRDTDFWWDLGNHAIWSFDQKFMVNLRAHLEASWAYMDAEQAAAASAA